MNKYKIIYACSTHIGNIRDENEDNFYIDGKIATNNIETITGILKNEKNLVSVCDGMGGEANGKEASTFTVEQIKQADDNIKNSDADVSDIIQKHINIANDDVCEMSQKKGAASGSTANIVYIDGNIAHSYNLGDSKTYLFRDNKLEQLSRDHTTVADLVRMGALSEEEAKTHPRRNQLNQFIGVPPARFKLEPHIKEIELCENDIILICSDGLTEMCENAEIISILSSEKNPEDAVKKLIDRTLNNGGTDNITVILLYVNGKHQTG